MATPVLKATSLDRALAFYTGTLGATLAWRTDPPGDPGYACVRWREHELHVSSHAGDSVFGAAVFIEVDDVDAVFSALRATGWTPRTERGPVFAGPTDQTWGTRELYVDDPDGNVLRFATLTRLDQ